MDGDRILAWARRWLRVEDVERVVEPAVADWRHETAIAPEVARVSTRRRGRRAVLGAILHTIVAERLALARRTPWWLLAFPLVAVAIGVVFAGVGPGQWAFFGAGALVFAAVATTPSRWLSPTWAWCGVGALALTLLAGESHGGATRWLALGPLQVQVTLLVLPLVVIGGWRPAAVAAGLLAAAPDALGGLVVALAVPHPVTLVAALVGVVREPAMTAEAMPALALVSVILVLVAAWRFRSSPEGRAVLALIVLGLGAHALGHAPMPLVGFGGSAVVATCLAFALAVRRARPWTDPARVG